MSREYHFDLPVINTTLYMIHTIIKLLFSTRYGRGGKPCSSSVIVLWVGHYSCHRTAFQLASDTKDIYILDNAHLVIKTTNEIKTLLMNHPNNVKFLLQWNEKKQLSKKIIKDIDTISNVDDVKKQFVHYHCCDFFHTI